MKKPKEHMHPYVYSSSIYNSEDMEAIQVLTNRFLKSGSTYVNEILFSHKKEWNLSIYDSMMDLEGIMLSKINQSEKKQVPHYFTYIWTLKNKRNKQNWNIFINTDNWLMVTREKRVGRLDVKIERIKKYKLVVTNSHRDVKYSRGIILNDVLINTNGARWVLEILRDHFVKYMIG